MLFDPVPVGDDGEPELTGDELDRIERLNEYFEEYGYLPDDDQLDFEREYGYEMDPDDEGDYAALVTMRYVEDDGEPFPFGDPMDGADGKDDEEEGF